MAQPLSSILYQNAEKNILLVDLPTSLSLAQGASHRDYRQILSSKPPSQPFILPEPKPKHTIKTSTVKQAEDEAQRASHTPLVNEINYTLREIEKHHGGLWCLPRRFDLNVTLATGKTRKRAAEDSLGNNVNNTQFDNQATSFESALHSSSKEPDLRLYAANLAMLSRFQGPAEALYWPLPDQETNVDFCFDSIADIYNHVIHNKQERPSNIKIPLETKADVDAQTQTHNFIIPPKCSFILSTVQDSQQNLSLSMGNLLSGEQFDIILLDPPWSNRSVKRSKSYSSNGAKVEDICTILHKLPLKSYLSADGLVAIWITNKQYYREEVLRKKGLFKHWGVELVEEWIWIKITEHGETVFDINSEWRRPYETLLIGRRGTSPNGSHGSTKRRFIVSVPDLHSRKPCLKGMYVLYCSSAS
jgi:N6-adenosine-specific RNA methylase IME4